MLINNVKIKDICEFIGGSQPPKSDFIYEPRKGYIRLIQTRDRLNDNFATYIPEKSTKKLCKKDDILIGRYGPPIFQIFRGFEGAYNVAIMKANPINGTDKDYLYYFLSQDSILRYVDSMSIRTGGQTGVELDSLYDYPVELPDINYQKKVSQLLLDIDRKIENNNKIISEFESMAKTIYDYWFLQFDFPDENGKPYKSSGGKMVWNEELKREIPEDFLVDNLSSIILNSKNGDWGNESYQSSDDIKIRCFRGADFPSIVSDYHVTAPIRFISKQHEDRILTDGDLVIEISGGSPVQSTGRIGYINKKFLDRNNSLMTCSNFCKAITLVNKEYQYWYYQTWKKYYDFGVFFNYEGKTTGIKNLMFDEFTQSVKVAIPPNTLLCKYHKIVSTLYDKIQHLLIENQELASLRDFLLPMLMNGQVIFKDSK